MTNNKLLVLGVAAFVLHASPVLAQSNNEASPNTIEGVIITSNSDNTGGEYISLRDSSLEVFYADGDVRTNVTNAADVGINYDTDNNGSGSFALQTGGANVLTADNAGTVTIANGMVTNGINNGGDGITNAGAVSGVTTLTTSGLATLNSAQVNTTLNVDGATTLNDDLTLDSNGAGAGGTRFVVNDTSAVTTSTNGEATLTVNNNGHTLAHVDGGDTNSVVIGDTQTGTIGSDTFDYGTTINGGLFVDGDMGVNGNIYALDPNASSGINVGDNGLRVDGENDTASLVADSNSVAGDGRGVISLEEDQASFYVYNATSGDPHGLSINQTETVLSGGTTSTTLTLNDSGATFADSSTGGPARVTGVADGTTRYDAVNYGQLKEVSETANAGVASVAAMANLPSPPSGKRFTLGLGFGHYEDQNAVAVGGAAMLHERLHLKASLGRANDNNTIGAGIGFSW